MRQGLRAGGWPGRAGVWLAGWYGLVLLLAAGAAAGQAVSTTNEVRAMRGLGMRERADEGLRDSGT